jgi:hypothetical protein
MECWNVGRMESWEAKWNQSFYKNKIIPLNPSFQNSIIPISQ